LLVDDETVLVHAPFSSQDALDPAKEYPRRIDVLVSDFEFQPEIQVLFMSGYAEGLLDMKLPFRFSALLESLRQLQSGN
jgi:hypothetical protein